MAYSIVRHEFLSGRTFLWEVLAPDVARAAEPGQFVMIRLHEGSERIPLTIADFDREQGTVTMVIQALGKTTREMMTYYRQGDQFADFVGPLGLGQHIERVGHVALVGGGLGVAPVFPQLRAFKQAGNRTTGVIGFRDRGAMFWEERFAAYCDGLIVCTDDGSYGKPGLVTAGLRDLLECDTPDLVVAIGPLPMMEACAETTRSYGVRTMVSLNSIMVDGTGMCGSCRVTVGGQVRFACVDGPDFDGHQVDFHELIARQRRFRNQEAAAMEDFGHVCQIEHLLFDEEKRNYKKIKDLAPHQVRMPERDAAERTRSFQEVNLGYSLKDALEEADRCIQCAKPTCIAGCPVGIDIPRFIRHLLVRDLDGALAVIHEANVFPSICGRVCPQESQCEAQCVIAKKVEPVAIGRLERFVGDNVRPPQAVPVAAARGPRLGRVAIVGSGPAGLACAADLLRYGVDVTIYEALHVVGGVLRYGIPSFRLPREIIDREIQRLIDLGAKVEVDEVIGKTFTVPALLGEKGFDAVFLGVGAGAPAFLGIPGEFAGQVYSANEFLTRVNLMGGDRFPLLDTPLSIGQSVVVIGAGNTAMDCLRVAKRLGVPAVRCVYRRTEAEAPARVEELRHAREEGIEFFFLHAPVEIHTDPDGNVCGMRAEKMTLGEPDDSGRRRPVPLGEYLEIECDTVIYALGTKANPIISQSTPDLGLNRWGYIIADEVTQAATLPGVFAGGDIVTGGATVILAMGAGRRAAKGIATYLAQGKRWPITPADIEAFVAARPGWATAHVPGRAGIRSRRQEGLLCPRCGQPLEGDEEYICCAEAVLAWRCRECGEVSEGFAFPYGLCPACGGGLESLGQRTFEGAAALEAIRAAFEIELGGQVFYRRAARDTTDPALRALFEKFAAMEEEHMATLARRYHARVPPPSDDFRIDSAAVYAGVPHRPEDPDNLFRIAIGLEERAVQFFTARMAASHGAVEWQLYKELAAEERDHVAELKTELARYTAGKPGLL